MEDQDNRHTRRDFVGFTVAGGIVAASGAASASPDIVETDVEIKTPDGTCDAAFIHPASGAHAGVLLWPDAFGLRPAMREMGRRLAADGYSVLVPNPFYRVSKAPFTDASHFSFQNPDDMAKLRPLMASVNAPGNPEKDATRLCRLPRRAKGSGHDEENRDPGLLHGRPARHADIAPRSPTASALAQRSMAAAW